MDDEVLVPNQADVEREFKRLFKQFKAKNNDYGNSVFKKPILAPELTIEQAIRVRASDKIERMIQLEQRDPDVVTESLDDTIGDLAVYMILLLAFRTKNKNKKAADKKPKPAKRLVRRKKKSSGAKS